MKRRRRILMRRPVIGPGHVRGSGRAPSDGAAGAREERAQTPARGHPGHPRNVHAVPARKGKVRGPVRKRVRKKRSRRVPWGGGHGPES